MLAVALQEQKGNDTTVTDFFRGLIARQAHNTLLDRKDRKSHAMPL